MEEMESLARRVFGIEHLRPLQAEAMEAMLSARDSLLVLPTGGGKSLTFQVPSMARPGVSLVVSPLISLMQDQVRGLTQHGVRAALLASGQSAQERRTVLRSLHEDQLDLLYLTPERLVSERFLDRLDSVRTSALVVDEAHCISHWGHAFRPEYRELAKIREHYPGLSVHACTATATERVREDIVRQLELRDPLVLVGSFDRPNLEYRFLPRTERKRQVLAIVERHRGHAAIVYALRRTDVDALTRELAEAGHRVRAYHAGLGDAERRANQEAFLNEEVDVVVATVAFGMGIDRPDVRLVLHAAMPKSLEHYLQESGRAGRDGARAECVLLFSGADYHGWRGLITEGGDHEDHEPALVRLGEMYAAASSARCRHEILVRYFGASWAKDSCGACDVCRGELPRIERSTEVARMILSAVYRVGQRFGAGHVIDVLRGSQNERVQRLGHERLSTFGLLNSLDAATLRAAIDQLIGSGRLELCGRDYPILRLGPTAPEALRGEVEVELFAPPRPPTPRRAREVARRTPSGTETELSAADLEVFEDLRELRRELASERRVRPYMSFPDATLRALAQERPADREAFLTIKGVGERKAEDFAEPFLNRLRSHDLDASA